MSRPQLLDEDRLEFEFYDGNVFIGSCYFHIITPSTIESEQRFYDRTYQPKELNEWGPCEALKAVQYGKMIFGSACVIEEVWVHPEYRKSGIGNWIMHWIEENHQVDHYILFPFPFHKPDFELMEVGNFQERKERLYRFYKRLGYRPDPYSKAKYKHWLKSLS